MPNNQIELGEFTVNLANITPTGSPGSQEWRFEGDTVDLGPGAHVAEVYAEITAFNLDGGTAPGATYPATEVQVVLTTSPNDTLTPTVWEQGAGATPTLVFREAPTLPQVAVVGVGVLQRYIQPQVIINEGTVAPGANATMTFSMSVLITSF